MERTPSGKAYRLCQLPPRGSLWHSGTVSGSNAKLPVSPEAPSPRELARERLRGFSPLKVSRKPFRSAALSQKAALQLPFFVTTPPVKMEHRSVRRRSGVPKYKIIFPLNMRKANAERIPNRPTQKAAAALSRAAAALFVLGCDQPFRKAGRGLPSLSHW